MSTHARRGILFYCDMYILIYVWDTEGLSEMERELKDLKDQFHEGFPIGPLIGKSFTMDQGKTIINFLDSILDKSLRSTVVLLVACGHGKSTALGLAIVESIAIG
ncbi:hypothetical protein GUJ93_ZPchr0007g3842 [Zizania palustris]|uniref:Uncharacterized protein n=1 Tax=Zizania palustris TaxID=103762 RepID=A0A8J5T7P3_ZIZPA|nr:hypothetical protein GUJ93_ZPchr0007g3842 [Zizania palustris]